MSSLKNLLSTTCLKVGKHRLYSTTSERVVIVSTARTPIACFRGSLSSMKTPDLGAAAVKAAIAKINLDSAKVDEVIMGCVLQAGLGQAPARQVALAAGLPIKTPTTDVNKVCASGMKSIMFGCLTLMGSKAQVVVAGGMESMSNVPFYMKRGETTYGGVTMEDGILKDGLSDAYQPIHMGNCGENTAKKLSISREEQDDYAILSYQRSKKAAEQGLLAKEITAVEIKGKKGSTVISEDEEYKRFDENKFRSLRTVFDPKNGTITAGNASKLDDGAAACILTTEKTAKDLGLTPLAEIIDFSDSAVEPIDFPIAPVFAMKTLFERNNLKKDQVDLYEINEAFSVVPLANIKLLNLDASKVNVFGGAVSMGHPIGMSGARIVTRLVTQLQSGQLGMASICNGGGGASALLLKKL